MTKLAAVIFDLDGVLVDSEGEWDRARRQIATETGGRWRNEATRAMMGMSSTEWSAYMHDELSVPLPPADVSRAVVKRITSAYRDHLPLMPGAEAAVDRMGERWRLGIASSSNRRVIDLVLQLAGIRDRFDATLSSEEVARGKPAPDVYLEVARRLGIPPGNAVAIEDSTNGINSAKAAGMSVIAIPNRAFPPESDALSRADLVLESLGDLSASVVETISAR